jgi:polysaccharide export outer membrane protein
MPILKRPAFLSAVICAVIVFASAGFHVRADPVSQAKQAGSMVDAANAAEDQEVAGYVLGAGDVVRISVFGEETLAGQFSVSGDGKISFPLIGDVQAAGKTVAQLRTEITAKLADGYLKDPRVSAEVINFRPYYILGEIEKPGSYPYVAGITVMNAIAAAGGFTYRANSHQVFIKKVNETSEHKVRLDGVLRLAPGDTVRVGERYF